MWFSKAARLQLHNRPRHGLGDWEVGGAGADIGTPWERGLGHRAPALGVEWLRIGLHATPRSAQERP